MPEESEEVLPCRPWYGETEQLVADDDYKEVATHQGVAQYSRYRWQEQWYANFCRTLYSKVLSTIWSWEDLKLCRDQMACQIPDQFPYELVGYQYLFLGHPSLSDQLSPTKSSIGYDQATGNKSVSEDESQRDSEECQQTPCSHSAARKETSIQNFCVPHWCWCLPFQSASLSPWCATSHGTEAFMICVKPHQCTQFQHYFLAWAVRLLVLGVRTLCLDQIGQSILTGMVFSREVLVCPAGTHLESIAAANNFRSFTEVHTSDWKSFRQFMLYQINFGVQVGEKEDGAPIQSHHSEKKDGVSILRHKDDLVIVFYDTASLLKKFGTETKTSISDRPGDVRTDEDTKLCLVPLNQELCLGRQANVKLRFWYHALSVYRTVNTLCIATPSETSFSGEHEVVHCDTIEKDLSLNSIIVSKQGNAETSMTLRFERMWNSYTKAWKAFANFACRKVLPNISSTTDTLSCLCKYRQPSRLCVAFRALNQTVIVKDPDKSRRAEEDCHLLCGVPEEKQFEIGTKCEKKLQYPECNSQLWWEWFKTSSPRLMSRMLSQKQILQSKTGKNHRNTASVEITKKNQLTPDV